MEEEREKTAAISLITDFGLKDGNVGVMKGVILSMAPEAKIVDVTHLIEPQNIVEAGLILLRSAPYFPKGTIHVVVVDPGVGTNRRPMAARLGDQFYVGPDNGIITMLLERIERSHQPVQMIQLDNPRYWLPDISNVFHGRDIFAPVAAHLANGVSLTSIGTPIYEIERLKLPRPEPTSYGLRGEVIHIDHFGNISSNIMREHLGDRPDVRVRLRDKEIKGMVRTFGDRPIGELIVLYGSTGNLIVSVVNGNAARVLGVRPGDKVEVHY
ncbi:MAG: hypothetical protein EHM41_23445 [Chloroflexi bacterium]|nr:MAG: hypothetical protein EHM41_23445 [Chloroflexota bacterium]